VNGIWVGTGFGFGREIPPLTTVRRSPAPAGDERRRPPACIGLPACAFGFLLMGTMAFMDPAPRESSAQVRRGGFIRPIQDASALHEAIGRGCQRRDGFTGSGFGREIPPLQRCVDSSRPLVMTGGGAQPACLGLSAFGFRLPLSMAATHEAIGRRCHPRPPVTNAGDHPRVLGSGFVLPAFSSGFRLLGSCFPLPVQRYNPV
jgi:hypothetical protein